MIQQSVRLPTDEHCSELVRGERKRLSPAGGEHGYRATRLGSRLDGFAHQHDLGSVCASETGFILRRDPDTVRAPDVAFVYQARLPEGKVPVGYLRVAPDLAVEVVFPSETAEEIPEKVRDYLEAGAEQVWLRTARLRTVVVHRPPDVAPILSETDVLDAGDLLPRFRIAVAEVVA